MSRLVVFNQVTLDGYFTDANGDMSWAHQNDPEWNEFVEENASGGSVLVFGRITYEMMKSYWPTPEAIKNDPRMADVMNNSPKIVFSRTMKRAEEGPNWKNITLLHEIDRGEIRKLKETRDITILGSGSIVQQLASAGLIDEYQLSIVPIVLGAGKSLFKDVRTMNLNRVTARTFQNGIVLLTYRPA